MREYGQVQCAFWSHPDIQELSDDGKLLALYLLTSPHSNGIGCFRVPDGYVIADLKWSQQRVSKGFAELLANGFSKRCESTDFVLLPKFLSWNGIANPNVAKARAEEARHVPKKFLYFKEFLTCLERFGNHWPNGFINDLGNGIPNRTLPNPTLPISKARGFAPPTPEDVAAYVRERGSSVDPQRFCDFYASKDWMVGKNKMKDWHASVRTWEKDQASNKTPERYVR